MPSATGETLDAAYYYSCNRGKRVVSADLSSAYGQGVVRRLAGTADVLIENFKVGDLARYGLPRQLRRRRQERF